MEINFKTSELKKFLLDCCVSQNQFFIQDFAPDTTIVRDYFSIISCEGSKKELAP